MKPRNRYLQLAISVFELLCLGSIYAWSVFRVPLGVIYPDWSITDFSTIFTISIICFCLGSFVSGKTIARVGHRITLLIAAAMLLAGFCGASAVISRSGPDAALPRMIICYGVLCGLGVGIGYNSILGTTIKWFPDMAGTASGIMSMGFGCGGLAVGSAAMRLIEVFDIGRTFFYLALFTASVTLFSAFALAAPSVEGYKPFKEKDDKKVISMAQLSSLQMIKTSGFWLFFVYSALVSSAGLIIINSGTVITASFGAPAIAGLFVSVFNGAGRIIIGLLFDKKGRNFAMLTNALILLFCGGTLLLCAVTNQPVFVLIGLPLVGIPYGGAAALVPAVTYSLFGSKYYSSNAAIMLFHMMPATVIGPLLYEQLLKGSGGTFHLTFIMIIAFALVMIIINAILTKILLDKNIHTI